MDIFRAAEQGDVEEVSRLLDEDPALLEKEGSLAYRPLALAAHTGQLRVVQLLVQRGAEINASGKGWRGTALHWAAVSGHEHVVAFLLSSGAQADFADTGGRTAIKDAFQYGHLGVVQMLLHHVGPQGLEARDEGGWTPLMEAARRGHMGVLQMLVQHVGLQGLDERNAAGRTALHWAAEEGHEEVLAFLLSKGAQAELRDVEGLTPLSVAARQGHVGLVQMLLQHRGRQGLEEKEDVIERGVLYRVLSRVGEAVWGILRGQGTVQTASTSGDGITPLMWACGKGHLDVVQVLVQHMGLQDRDVEGRTALHWAVGRVGEARHLWLPPREGHEDVVWCLLLAGADPSITDKEGRTPRASAVEKGFLGCAGVFEHWCEGERRYLLQRARCLHDAYTTHRDKPTAPVPAFLQKRAAAGQALPEVEILVVARQQGGEQEGAGGTIQAPSEADAVQDVEEERYGVLAYVLKQLNEQLFTEVIEGLRAPVWYSGRPWRRR